MNIIRQNVVIAEACGWTYGNHNWFLRGTYSSTPPPNYTLDLNAMHEAERMLSENQFKEYKVWLGMINADDYQVGKWKDSVCATASQRAEAFIKAIGKWED